MLVIDTAASTSRIGQELCAIAMDGLAECLSVEVVVPILTTTERALEALQDVPGVGHTHQGVR